jgi:putative MATE family efflux protein
MAESKSFQPTYKNIWGISFPIIIAGLSETIVDVTDTIFLAHYGLTELAAVGLAATIYGVSLFLTLGLVDGIQIIIGRRVGAQQLAAIGEVFNQGLYLLALAATVMILFIIFAVPMITVDLLASENIHKEVNVYLQITAYALLFQSFNLAYSAFYVGISKTRVLIGATAVLAVTNIILDYAMIFGNLGFEEMGIEGAAYASLTAEIAACLYLTADVIWRGYNRQYNMLRFTRWKTAISKHLIAISSPISLEMLVESLKWFLFFIIIEQISEQALGIATIIFSCYALLLIPIDSFSETICSMTSNLIGQKKIHHLGLLIRRTTILSYVAIFPMLLLTLLFPEYILAVFTTDADMIAGSIGSLGVIALAILIAVPGEIFYSTLVGTGDTRIIFTIQMIITFFTLSFAYIAALVLALELEYIWLAEVFGWLVCLLLSWLWFRSGIWQRLDI